MRMVSFHLTAQGASHIKKNKECQDASGSYQDDDIAIAVVCDGHGGDDYVRSAKGSEFACQIALKNIEHFVRSVQSEELDHHSNKLLTALEASIINDWNEAVWTHYSSNPFQDQEISVLSDKAKRRYLTDERVESAYGTTLIAVAVTKEYWFGIHIGDGKCVAINPEGAFLQPIPWDEKCFLNATTSICDSDAIRNFRSFYSKKLPVAVFVGSDGVDDCFSNDQQLNSLYTTVLYSFASTGFESAVEDLRDYLPRLSQRGSGDDVSIAAVLDLDKIGEIESVRDFDREKEKARIEENARKEAQKAEEERQRVEREHQVEEKGVIPRFCSHCGAKLSPKARFCSECGHKNILETAKKEAPHTAQTIEEPSGQSQKEERHQESRVVYDVEMVPGEGPRIVEVNINKPKQDSDDLQNTNTEATFEVEGEDFGKGKDMTIIKVVTYDNEGPQQETDDTIQEEQHLADDGIEEDAETKEIMADEVSLSGKQEGQYNDGLNPE